MNANWANGNSFAQTGSTFTKDELAALLQDRKRYLASSFMLFGMPPEQMIEARKANEATTVYQEETTFAYQNGDSNISPTSPPQSPVGFRAFPS